MLHENHLAIGTAAIYKGQWPAVGGEMWNVRIPVANEETTIVIRPGIEDLRKEIEIVSEKYGVPFPKWPGAKIYPWGGAVEVQRMLRKRSNLTYVIIGTVCAILGLVYLCLR